MIWKTEIISEGRCWYGYQKMHLEPLNTVRLSVFDISKIVSSNFQEIFTNNLTFFEICCLRRIFWYPSWFILTKFFSDLHYLWFDLHKKQKKIWVLKFKKNLKSYFKKYQKKTFITGARWILVFFTKKCPIA